MRSLFLTCRWHCRKKEAQSISWCRTASTSKRLRGRLQPLNLGLQSLDAQIIVREQLPLLNNVLHREGRRAPQRVRAFIDLAIERLRAEAAFT